MSDILIKNMKMPEWCVNCPMITTDCNSDYLCSVLDEYIPMKWKKIENNFGFYNKETYPRPDWCPLIEVPPHGRLGDLDKLEQMFVDIDNAPYSGFDGSELFYSAEDAAQIIRLSPTIIESEGT